MNFTAAEIEEFKTESLDLIEQAEKGLMALDHGQKLAGHYDSIFRAFHSIKGAAGMMDLTRLQSHMHQLENLLVGQKDSAELDKVFIDLFLRGLDGCRRLLDGHDIEFDYTIAERKSGPVTIAILPAKIDPKVGNVVVIDDEIEMVETLVALLSAKNFEVHGCSDPKQIDDLMSKHNPDLVLTDVSMPGMGGVEVLAAVKRINTDVPVIFVSGHLYHEALVQAIGLGIYGVIEKPFDHDRIAEICRQAVERHQISQLFNKAVNLLLYQFSDLAQFLEENNRDDIKQTLSREITEVLERRRRLRLHKTGPST